MKGRVLPLVIVLATIALVAACVPEPDPGGGSTTTTTIPTGLDPCASTRSRLNALVAEGKLSPTVIYDLCDDGVPAPSELHVTLDQTWIDRVVGDLVGVKSVAAATAEVPYDRDARNADRFLLTSALNDLSKLLLAQQLASWEFRPPRPTGDVWVDLPAAAAWLAEMINLINEVPTDGESTLSARFPIRDLMRNTASVRVATRSPQLVIDLIDGFELTQRLLELQSAASAPTTSFEGVIQNGIDLLATALLAGQLQVAEPDLYASIAAVLGITAENPSSRPLEADDFIWPPLFVRDAAGVVLGSHEAVGLPPSVQSVIEGLAAQDPANVGRFKVAVSSITAPLNPLDPERAPEPLLLDACGENVGDDCAAEMSAILDSVGAGLWDQLKKTAVMSDSALTIINKGASDGADGAGTSIAVLDGGFDLGTATELSFAVCQTPEQHGCLDLTYLDAFPTREPISGEAEQPEPEPAGETSDDVHGTLVAFAAHRVAPAARIVPIDISDRWSEQRSEAGIRADLAADTARVTKALGLLAQLQAAAPAAPFAAVNLSWGYEPDGWACEEELGVTTPRTALRAEVERLRSLGVLTAAASGNKAQANVYFPACAPEVVGVGATTEAIDELTGLFSPDRFPNGVPMQVYTSGPEVQVLAPGIFGTSFAAPRVAGAAAVLRSEAGAAPTRTVERALVSGADYHWALPEQPEFRLLDYRGARERLGQLLRNGSASSVVPDSTTGSGVLWNVSPNGVVAAWPSGGDHLYSGARFGFPCDSICPGLTLNGEIIGMLPAADDEGYWLIARDGGVFTFGSAEFYGSLADLPLNACERDGDVLKVQAFSYSVRDDGYRFLGCDGGVFTLGTEFYGRPELDPGDIAVDLATTVDSTGYVVLTEQGRIFGFGSLSDLSGSVSVPVGARAVGLELTRDGRAAYVVMSDGTVGHRATAGAAAHYVPSAADNDDLRSKVAASPGESVVNIRSNAEDKWLVVITCAGRLLFKGQDAPAGLGAGAFPCS